jgi:hypothetical protein
MFYSEQSIRNMRLEELVEIRPDLIDEVLDLACLDVDLCPFMKGQEPGLARERWSQKSYLDEGWAESTKDPPKDEDKTQQFKGFTPQPYTPKVTVVKKCSRTWVKPLDGAKLGWKIKVPLLTWRKLFAWWASHTTECSGMGMLQFDEPPKLGEDGIPLPWEATFGDVELLSTHNTGAHTVISGEALARYYHKLIITGQDVTKARLWWHSHVEMGRFWSNTDDECIFEFLSEQLRLVDKAWFMRAVLSMTRSESELSMRICWDYAERGPEGVQLNEIAVDNIPYEVEKGDWEGPEVDCLFDTVNRRRGYGVSIPGEEATQVEEDDIVTASVSNYDDMEMLYGVYGML